MWSVTFRVSGGFAGVNRDLEISSTGGARAVDRRSGTEATIRVPDSELAALGAVVTGATPQPMTRHSSCRDCFTYHLEIRIDDQRLSVDLDDQSLDASNLGPLIAALKSVQDRALIDYQKR
jgi:hypothetical protein